MKKLIFLFGAAIMVIAFACKSGPSSNDPKATLMSFFKALSKKDLTEARKYATKESEGMLSMMEMGLKMADTAQSRETDEEFKKFDESSMEIGEAKIEGDRATVPVKNKEEGESTNFILKKEDGAWKVAFDKATMAEMAGEKIRDAQTDETVNMDPLTNELKNLDTDSVKKAVQEGLKVLDSLKKQ